MACDLRTADWGKALNSHCGRGLGPGHTATPMVSRGGTSGHHFAAQAPGGVGDFLMEKARLVMGAGA